MSSQFGYLHIIEVVLRCLTGSVLRIGVILDLGWRSAHLLLFDNVALLELLQTELHHFLLEVSVLDNVLLAVVGVSHQVCSQLV